LDDLAAGLAKGGDTAKAAGPASGTVASPEQRLDAMTDRTWALRQAVVIMRTPLESFYDALDAAQKARLDGAPAEPERRETNADADAGAPNDAPHSGASSSGPARLCGDPAARMTAWPGEQIERRVRPTQEQRASLQMLQMTTQGMAQMLLASCPRAAPATPLDRLDAAEKRLNAMLYATRVVGPA